MSKSFNLKACVIIDKKHGACKPTPCFNEPTKILSFEHIAKFLIEFIYATCAIDNFLFACVEWVALGTYFHMECVFFHCRTGGKCVATRTSYGNIVIIWVNICFHCDFLKNYGCRDCAYTSLKQAGDYNIKISVCSSAFSACLKNLTHENSRHNHRCFGHWDCQT